MSDRELQQFFKFDESDLFANRMGRFSAKQEKRIQEMDKSSSKTFRNFGFGLIFINILVVGGMILSAVDSGFSFSAASQDDIVQLIVACGYPHRDHRFLCVGFVLARVCQTGLFLSNSRRGG
jgi:hypothetical protein